MANNIQRVAPFIRQIQASGGTFYTFTSAFEDFTLSFNEDTTRKFKFSKFALINMPDIISEPIKNTIKLNGIPGAYNSVNFNRTNDYNNHFGESFQNYCLNLETAIRSKENYDSQNAKTVTERVFFKWLKELSALRFTSEVVDSIQETRYLEEVDSEYYDRVVQYVGSIDFMNNYSGVENSYTEVYFHVPTEVGNFPNVYFKSEQDDNYYPGMAMCRNADGEDNEYIYGRHHNDSHPAGLDFHAFYDNDVGLGTGDQASSTGPVLYRKKDGKGNDDVLLCNGVDCNQDYDVNKWWYYPTSETNCYYTEPLEFTNPYNRDYAIHERDATSPNESAVRFRRSNLDGIGIDFDETTYKSTEQQISHLIDIARSPGSKDFEFNAILVYYDVYEKGDCGTAVDFTTPDYSEDAEESGDAIPLDYDALEEDCSNNILATNLFGILFLDNVENNLSLGGGYIPRFKKCIPNSVVNLNGNAYGFKLNIKLDGTPISSGVQVETIISDSNTLSMDIYADALNQMRETAEDLQNNTFNNLLLEQRIRTLEDFSTLNTQYNITALSNKFKTLENMISNEGDELNFAKSQSDLISLINANQKMIREIITGKIPTQLSINLDLIKQGIGTKIDRTATDVTISSVNNNLNLGDVISCEVRTDWEIKEYAYTYEISLNNLKNYIRLEETRAFTPNKDMKFYINDNNIKWTKGQVYRIYLAQPYKMINEFGNFSFYIYTGISQGEYKIVSTVDSYQFELRNHRPVMELICIDETNLEFKIDYLN